VSRQLIRRFALAGLLLAATIGARVAYANAPSLGALSADALIPSEPPALLEPITETGRTGWACRPERAAAASNWRDADLPVYASRR
jgi:hypothetical protein